MKARPTIKPGKRAPERPPQPSASELLCAFVLFFGIIFATAAAVAAHGPHP